MRDYPKVSNKDKYFYVEQEGFDWGVFGDNSGHAYGLHSTKEQAQQQADELNTIRSVE